MQVVVVINGGVLDGLFASDPDIEAFVIDWDNINEGDTGFKVQPNLIDEMPEETKAIFDAINREENSGVAK